VLHSSYRFLHLFLKRFHDCIRSERTLYKSFLHYITTVYQIKFTFLFSTLRPAVKRRASIPDGSVFLYSVLKQLELTRSHDDVMLTYTLSLIGCDTSSSLIAGSAARLHVGTMRETPVRVRLSMFPTAVTSVQTEDVVVARQRQKSWQADVTVRKHEPQYVTLPTDAVCSPLNNNGVNTNGM